MSGGIQIDPNFRNPAVAWQHLAKLPVFRNFTEKELRDVYGLGEIRVYQPTSNIIIEGEPTSGLYVILEGTAAVYRSQMTKYSGFKIASLEKGDAFGELSLLDSSSRSATVVAETPLIAFYLDGKSWEQAAGSEPNLRPKFVENCAVMLSKRLRELDDSYLESQRQLWKFVLSRSPKMEKAS